MVSVENGSNAVSNSEGQGSAAPGPGRSIQEEESAFSAAEEVAGPAHHRHHSAAPMARQARVNRAGNELLRPTASMVSTAVQRHARASPRAASPPSPPKAYRTHSVVSQSLPNNHTAPTPGSVYGQMGAAAGNTHMAFGAGPAGAHPVGAAAAAGADQQQAMHHAQLPPHALVQQSMATQNGSFNPLGAPPLNPSMVPSQGPMVDLPSMAAAAMLLAGQPIHLSPSLQEQVQAHAGSSGGDAGPAAPEAAGSGAVHPAISAWAAVQQLGLMPHLAVGLPQMLLPPPPLQSGPHGMVGASPDPEGVSASALGHIMPGLAAGTSVSMQQEPGQSGMELLRPTASTEGIAGAAAGLHLVPQGSSAAIALNPQPVGAAGPISPTLHLPPPHAAQPGHSRVGSVMGNGHPPAGQQMQPQSALASPALSLVCPLPPQPAGGVAAPAHTHGRNHHQHVSLPGGAMAAALPSQMSAHRHSNNQHAHDAHHAGPPAHNARGHLLATSTPEPAPAVSCVGEHGHVAAHARPAASHSCVNQQQGTGVHASALRPPSRLAVQPSGMHGEADGDNDACDDNEGVLASTGEGQLGMHLSPAQPVGSAVVGPPQQRSASLQLSRQPSGAQHQAMALLSSAGEQGDADAEGKAGQALHPAGSAAVGFDSPQQGPCVPGQSVLAAAGGDDHDHHHHHHHGGEHSIPAGSNHDPHEAVSQAGASVLAHGSRPALTHGAGAAADDQAHGAEGAASPMRWSAGGAQQAASPVQQWEEADTRSVDGVAQGAADGVQGLAADAGWRAELGAHMSDADVEPDAEVASQAAAEHISRLRSSSSRSVLSASASGSGGGSGGGPDPGGGGVAISNRPQDSMGMAADLGIAEPAQAMIVGMGPQTEEGDPSVSDAEAGGGLQQQQDSAGGVHQHHRHASGDDVGNSKYGGAEDRSPTSSLAHALHPVGSIMTATAGNAAGVSVAAAAAMLALGLGASTGVAAHGNHVGGASSLGEWQQGSGEGHDPQGERMSEIEDQPAQHQDQDQDAPHQAGQLDANYHNAAHPAASVHAMVITHDPPEAEAAWQQHSGSAHCHSNNQGPHVDGPPRSASPQPHNEHPAQRPPGASNRSATISGGAGAPAQSNTVQVSWRADSQMAEASQSSSGDAPVSHGAEAGGAQLSNERAYSVERASRSHVEAPNAAQGAGLGGGAEADSDMEDEGAGPQYALNVGSPMAGSVANGSTLLAGPDTPTGRGETFPADGAGAAVSVMSNGGPHPPGPAGGTASAAGLPGDGGQPAGSAIHHPAVANGIGHQQQPDVASPSAGGAAGQQGGQSSVLARGSKSAGGPDGQVHSTARGSGSSINGSQRVSKRKRSDAPEGSS